ncbi:MAG: adenylate/guanylate cyclase domain-containing protein [Dehalococcoidia bacterium]|nr:adenylate/guanylate cyclase domain-containing protein [Dehalococcoidia bacterium]
MAVPVAVGDSASICAARRRGRRLMEPRIQYAKTSDGISIAFWTLGEGEPLVHIAPAFSHLQLEWQIPKIRAWYERLAQRRKLIRYDMRGMGLSQRDMPAYSPESGVLDLEAVVGRLGLDRVALLGPLTGGPLAITYAALNPERVSQLILWCAYARAADWAASPTIQAIRALIDKDLDTYAETTAHLTFGWSAGEEASQFAALIRASSTPESVAMGIRTLNEIDVTPLLSDVRCSALVLHRREMRLLSVDVATGLASRIPQARLVMQEGEAPAPYLGDMEAVAAAIDEFLGEGEEAAGEVRPLEPSAVHTILFTDIEGSTAMTQRLGDAKAREVLREHERIVREALRAHGGSEVKTMGDGFMASFGSATKALECAIAVQQAFEARNVGVGAQQLQDYTPIADELGAVAEPLRAPGLGQPPVEPIRVRIGLNAGEPIAEDDPDGRSDLFGTTVIRAARIAALAQGGEILAANVVRELAEGKGYLFGDRGEVALRGFDDPVRVFEVRWRSFDSPSAAATGGSG